MEWYGYLICGFILWLVGFAAGHGVGRAAALSQIVAASALSQMRMPPALPTGPQRHAS